MLGVEGRVQVYAYGAPADMRKGFEGLSGLVREGLGRDPLSGALYLFTNRRRDRAKVLWFDGTGLCVYAKRLERGRFAKLWSATRSEALVLSRTELDLFVQGSHLVGRVELSPRELTREELAITNQMRQ